jgi:hypothetical protein
MKMKKILALVLAVVCLGAATAYAAPSVTKTEPVPTLAVVDEVKIDTDDVVEEFPMSILKITSVGQAKKLDEADQKAFLAEYDAVKDMKDGKVVSCFFCAFKEGQEVELKEGDEFLVTFNVKGVKEGDNVVVRLNGKELAENKVEVGNGKVTVRVTEFGVFTIIVK